VQQLLAGAKASLPVKHLLVCISKSFSSLLDWESSLTKAQHITNKLLMELVIK
jgi:hypothetical protein